MSTFSYLLKKMPRLRLLAASAATAATLLAPAAANAQEVDRVVLSAGADMLTFNPLDVYVYVPDRMLISHITDTLLRWEAPGKLIPWLATDWKYIDDLTLELKLRQGVKFDNGEPFNAETVKFFYDSNNDPNIKAFSRTNHTWVSHVDIVDEYTVRLVSKAPFPAGPAQLAIAYMVPPGYIKEVGWDGYARKPIGTGAFKLVEHVRDDHITLEAKTDWWGGPPQIKELVYRPIKEEAARASAVVAGEVDVGFDMPPEFIPMLQGSGQVDVKQVLSARTYIMQMNTVKPEYRLNNAKLREAITYALDTEALNKAVLAGTGSPAAFLSQSMVGLKPDLKPIKQDVERSKQALVDAGYPDGIDLVLDTSEGRYVKDRELAEAIAGQLSAVNIRTVAKPMEWGLLQKKRNAKDMDDLNLMAWGDVNSDPETMNSRVLASDGPQSLTVDPELDALMKKIGTTVDPEVRNKMIAEQQDLMRAKNQVAFLLHIGIITGVSKKMEWWNPIANETYYFYNVKK